jgi:hypothetical protein
MNSKQDTLINLMKVSHQEQKHFIATLTEGERNAAGTAENWSPKDVLAHVVHWDAHTAANLADPGRDHPDDGDDLDFNQINDRVWGQYKDASWAEIEELVDKAHTDMVNSLAQLNNEQLADTERYEWTRGRPAWRSVAFGCFYHPMQHVAELWVKRGDVAYGNKIQERAAELQLALAEDDDWQGTVFYNLGCHYALTGQEEKALELVERGIALYPYLKEWAPQDSDLKSIHDDPAFKAMID